MPPTAFLSLRSEHREVVHPPRRGRERRSLRARRRPRVDRSCRRRRPPRGPGARAVRPIQRSECEPGSPEQIQHTIEDAASREGLATNLLSAVIRKESAFSPCAVSSKGAQGLMQLMPAIQTQFGVTNPFDTTQNINAGAKLLKLLLARYDGDVSLALSAYNAGPGRVDQSGGIPPIPETVSYVSEILKNLSGRE